MGLSRPRTNSDLPVAISPLALPLPPAWHMCAHERIEEAAVRGKSKVQQFMDNDEVLEPRILVHEIGSKGNRANG